VADQQRKSAAHYNSAQQQRTKKGEMRAGQAADAIIHEGGASIIFNKIYQ